MIFRWSELTGPELSDRIDAAVSDSAGSDELRHSLAVLVLGAIEQHGPHLPVATDLIIGEGLCEAMLAKLDASLNVFVLPSLAMGASQEHSSLDGTLSLPPTLAMGVIEAVGDSLAASGLRRLVLINAHGGNHAVIDSAALTLRRRHDMLVVKANYMKLPPPPGLLAADELREGLHGGQAETAMMLHLAPDQVRRDRSGYFPMRKGLGDDQGLFGPAGRASWAWMAHDLNAQGVVGRADRATAEDGQRLIESYAAQLAEVVEHTAAMPWPASS